MKSALMVLMACITLMAASEAESSTWFTGEIRKVYPLHDGSFVLIFKNDSPACTSASSPKYHYVRPGNNSVTQEGLDAMLSVALAAGMAGKKISINFDETSTSCYVNRLSIDFES